MSVFRKYIKEKTGVLLCGAGIMGIFLTVGILYQSETEALEYASILSIVLLLLVFLQGFWRYCQKYEQLEKIRHQELPDVRLFDRPDSMPEWEYQEIAGKLEKCRKNLAEANVLSAREMSEYYGMWIHQVKTPIAAMNLLEQSLERDLPKEKRLKELRAELFKTEQYVEMVLTYLRTQEMSGDLDFHRVSLDDCIRQAVRKYSNLFILRRIRLDFEVTGETVLTDEKWLSFVLEQILSNALKYTEEGGSIHICRCMEHGKRRLLIKDTGIGIQAEDLPRIFERGFTGYNGRSSKKASGIGLYLTKRILDRLGSRIEIRSEIGVGTKVFLDLFGEEGEKSGYLTEM